MESRHRPAEELTPEQVARTRFRMRLLAACVALVGLVMVQSPGLLVADTKFDLATAPADFLARAFHLWDSEGAFGQLQNQAYGYLWPMGPFFLLGSLLDVPGWVVQRLWVALVMCVALTGAARLARALGVRSDLACILAGVAYALSPRMLTTLGTISIEAWPSALAPWVLLPLVTGSVRGSARRAAALSALAVAMVGGVNAAATFAVLPLGVLWLLTREPGPRRRTMMIWWPLFTALGTLWWLIPLFVMGAYSPPFLDYIESASNTTFPTTLFDALRGTSHWVPYVDQQARAGNDLIRHVHLSVNSGVVLFLGLAGLLQHRNPHRLFLAMGVMLGLLMVTMGHLGSLQGWGAVDLQTLLDGVLAPLRNVHKFDPVLRLPLVLGVAILLDALISQLREHPRVPADDSNRVALLVRRLNLNIVIGTAVVAVLGASLPAVAARITPGGGLDAVPDYWTQAAAWLRDEEDQGTALLVPGSSFGDYVWGTPRDEPMQALAASPWAVRNAVPLTPPGNIRMLDAIERRLTQGVGSAGLTTYLRRAGVTHLVVRNDLARSEDVPDPVLVHQALDGSPGLRRVATFGPDVGGEAHLDDGDDEDGRVLVNGGWQNEYPALEVFEVGGTQALAVGSDALPVVVGGPEDLLDLTDQGLLDVEPTVLAADAPERIDPEAPLILTDGLHATERHFGRVHDGTSATLLPGEERRMGNPTRDYLGANAEKWSTTARIQGVEAISASSSMSDANAYGAVQRGQLPYAAFDGRPDTAWRANYRTDAPAWWQVDFEAPRRVERVVVTAGADGREVIRVRTPDQVGESISLAAGASRTVAIGTADSVDWIRVEDASGRVGNRLTLAEVDVPGLTARRSLVLPSLPDGWGIPDHIVLRAVTDARTGCVEIDAAVRCVPGREGHAEEPWGFKRDITLSEAADFGTTLDVRAAPGDSLNRLLMEEQPVGVSASSRGNPDSRASVLAAIDGDPGTTWTAALDDLRPTVRMNWIGMRRLTGLRLTVAADTAARLPSRLTMIWPDGRREVKVDEDGQVEFPSIRTDQLSLRVEKADPVSSLDFDSAASPVPVGISELRVKGLPFLPVLLPDRPVRFPCGSGPTVSVNDRTIVTSVTASPAELYDGDAVTAELCNTGFVPLDAGENQIDVVGSDSFVPTALVLSGRRPSDAPAEPIAGPVTGARSGPVDRSLTPGGWARFVAVRENTNPGWVATQSGHDLKPVVVDGWQQGWLLADAGETVSVTFAPDRPYRWGLLGGFLAVLALVLVSCVPGRRWRDSQSTPVGPRDLPAAMLASVTLVAAGLLAGWVGVLVAAGAFFVASVLSRRAPETAPWLLAGLVLPAAAAYALYPWGGGDGWAGAMAWPHYFVVAACASLLGLGAEAPVRRPRFLRRIPGFSTSR